VDRTGSCDMGCIGGKYKQKPRELSQELAYVSLCDRLRSVAA
jgi:hypothetical protein